MAEKGFELDFDNTEVAYRNLTDRQLLKSYYLYSLMSLHWLIKKGSDITKLFLKLKLPIKSLIKNTIFSQFCGGEDLEETKIIIDKLKDENIEVLLNYSVEGLDDAESYRATYLETLKAIRFSVENPSIRAICIKFTGFASIDLWTKLQKGDDLNSSENKEYIKAREYIYSLCEEAVKCDVHIYIDAEESWFQDSIDSLVEELMEKYNSKSAYIFNTFQMYRNDKYDYLIECIENAKNNNYILGAKIVRGAYVEKENVYAEDYGVKLVLNSSKQKTDEEFDKAMKLCVDNIENVSISCATHNEKSLKKFALLLKSNNIKLNHHHVSLSQLFGMSDHLTYNLSEYGVNVAKYIPYGPLIEVIPYLIRRAHENTSVKGQMGRELSLLKNEKLRRGI